PPARLHGGHPHEESVIEEPGAPQSDPERAEGALRRARLPAAAGAQPFGVRQRLSLLRAQDRQPVAPQDLLRPAALRVLGPAAVPLPEQAGRRSARHQGPLVRGGLPARDDRLAALRQLSALRGAAEAPKY